MSEIQARIFSLAQDGAGDKLASLLSSSSHDISLPDTLEFIDQSNGFTPLMFAAKGDYVDAVEALLNGEKLQAELNFQSPKDGRTALHVAAYYGSLDVLEILLRAGADPEIQDHSGHTVRQIEEVDEESSIDAHSVRSAIESTIASLARPIDLDDAAGSPHAATEEQNEEEEDAPQESEHVDELTDADLSLHQAVREGDVIAAQHAMDAGANPDIPDRNGFTPLMLAAAAGHLPLVQFLIVDCAVDRDAQEELSGRNTALMFAVLHGQAECVEWMIAEGACAVFGLNNNNGDSADTIHPQEKLTSAQMEEVFTRALKTADSLAAAAQLEEQDEQQQDESKYDELQQQQLQEQEEDETYDQNQLDAQDEELRQQEEELQHAQHQVRQQHAKSTTAVPQQSQHQQQQYAHHPQQHQQQQSRSYAPSDARAFTELPLSEALNLLVTRYRDTCIDVGQQPSEFIASAINNIAFHGLNQGTLMLSGKDCESVGLRKLKKIDERLSDHSFAPLLEVFCFGFPSFPLRILDISSNHLTSHSIGGIAAFICGSSTLTSLDISNNDIDRIGGESLAQSLAREGSAINLSKINLSNNPLGSAALSAWAALLEGNHSITDLNLGNTECEQLPLMKICSAVSKNKYLKRLNLDGPLLRSHNEETTIHLSRTILALNQSLVSLSLKGHHITDTSASWLSEFLLPHPSLTELDLRKNNLTSRGVASFIKPISHRRVECFIPLDGNFLKGATYEEIEYEIQLAKNNGARNNIVFNSRQEKQSLRAKAPL
jgi:ankyrin repeat protein